MDIDSIEERLLNLSKTLDERMAAGLGDEIETIKLLGAVEEMERIYSIMRHEGLKKEILQ